MKKLLLFTFLVCLFSTELRAQAGMTDSQVVQFIERETKMGTQQSQIVTKLVQRGVKVDQIRRVRNMMSKSTQKSATSDNSEPDSRLRTEEGSDFKDVTLSNTDTESSMTQSASDNLENVMSDVDLTSTATTEDTGKKIFGHDIFNQRLLSFEPNMNIATPSNYVLGPGDVAVVDIYGASQKSMQLTVSPEGTIIVPGYGPIQVSGMSVESANAKVRSLLGSRYSSSNIKVTVGKTRTILVNVMGEVVAPGTYRLSSFATVFHALYMAERCVTSRCRVTDASSRWWLYPKTS